MTNRRMADRRGFTLVELLMVIAIIGIVSSIVLVGLWQAQQDARVRRTEAQIERLNELLLSRWEAYRTRAVPMKFPPGTPRNVVVRDRLYGLRELMRMEMPDRVADVVDPAAILIDPSSAGPPFAPLQPSLWRTYRRRARAALGAAWPTAWTTDWQGAECLYLIVSTLRDGDTNGLDFFAESEIGDTDGDGMFELLDGFGQPIRFLRWAPGFSSPASGYLSPLSRIQIADPVTYPDPFDPLKIDPRWSDADPTNDPFLMYPLIYAAGPDGGYDIQREYTPRLRYATTAPPNDPYINVGSAPIDPPLGTPLDVDGDGELTFTDNITNHFIEVR